MKKFTIYNLQFTKIRKILHFTFYILHSRAGFTLVEALIGVVVSSLIGVLLISILVQNNGLLSSQSANINQNLSTNIAIDTINESIKSASAIAASYPVVNPQYYSSVNSIILKVPALDTSLSPISNVSDYIIITKDAQKPAILRKLVFPDATSARKSADEVLTTRLSLLNFFYLDDTGSQVSPVSATRINFVVNQNERAGLSQVQSSSSGQINLRNN